MGSRRAREAGGVNGRRAASDAAVVAAKTRSANVERDGDRAGGMQEPVVRGGVCRASRAYVHEPVPTGERRPSCNNIGTPSRRCRTLRTCLTRPSEPSSPPPPPAPQSRRRGTRRPQHRAASASEKMLRATTVPPHGDTLRPSRG